MKEEELIESKLLVVYRLDQNVFNTHSMHVVEKVIPCSLLEADILENPLQGEAREL